jgi:hypothetical protein
MDKQREVAGLEQNGGPAMDRTTKVLLAAIALGLWANAVWPTARADDSSSLLRSIDSRLSSIDSSLRSHLSTIESHLSTVESRLSSIDGHVAHH